MNKPKIKIKSSRTTNIHKTLYGSILIVVAMFGFSFALVPIYNVLCKTLGINGKTTNNIAVNALWVDKSRRITVTFIATNNANLPWTFYPKIKKIILHPGENAKIAYFAKNNSKKLLTVQAIPSVSPAQAAKHLKKTQCFCFNRQTLKPQQSMDMPLIFYLDNALPKNIHDITLSYTLFSSTKH